MNIHELKAQREGNKTFQNILLKGVAEFKQKVWTELSTEIDLLRASFAVAMQDLIKEKTVELNQRLAGIVELKGEQGLPGPAGEDGRTPTPKELLDLIIPRIPQTQNGVDGHTATDEELLALIRPLIPYPEPGYTPTDEELLKLIVPLIPKPQEINIEEIIKIIEARPIAASRITGLAKLKGKKYLHGGGTSTGGGVNYETPVGAIDGVNLDYTVSNTPKAIILRNMTYFENEGYTLSGLTISIDPSLTPQTDDSFKSLY